MVTTQPVNPPGLGAPRGYSNAFLVSGLPKGSILFLAGQIGAEAMPDGRLRVVPGGFVVQFEKALQNVLQIVRSAGGRAEDVVEMTVYVTDIDEYRESRKELRDAWKRTFGDHYPAMTLVGAVDLFEEDARVEIRAVAAFGPPA